MRGLSVVVAAAMLVACGDVSVPGLPDSPGGDDVAGDAVVEAPGDSGVEAAVDPGTDRAEEAGKEGLLDPGADVATEVVKPKCDDDNPCTLDSEEADGSCRHAPLNEGACEDDDPCTEAGVCFAGNCAGKPVNCDDGNPCTIDVCDRQQGCVHPADDAATCDDGNACTRDDYCADGKCHAGSVLLCDDGNHCTDDACDPLTGDCTFAPNTAQCSDGDPCTEGDTCAGGGCTGGPPATCDDGNECTEDRCLSTQGCTHAIIPGCMPCAGDQDCNDANPCTTDRCVDTKCASEPATGPACDDKNPCTDGDSCTDGNCMPGALKTCDDMNPCTDDYCNVVDGTCGHAFNTAGCEDGNRCTTGDVCANGLCSGQPVVCDDANVCSDDACDPATGKCVFTPNNEPCNDGRDCTTNDVCGGYACSGTPNTCDDGQACTKDECVEGAGCRNDPIPGCLSCGAGTDCNDGKECTKDECINTQCKFTPLDGTTCQDGSLCTEGDRCQAGVCKPGPARVCDDGKTCTADSCDPVTGCVFTPVSGGCDDGDPCTGPDTCSGGTCVPGPLLCCAGKPDGTACSDSDNSTSPDFCFRWQCVGVRKVTFSAGPGLHTFLTDVDASEAGVFTTGYSLTKLTPATVSGFIAGLSFGATPTIDPNSRVSGKAYRAISRGLAVGDGALVATRYTWSDSAVWQVGGPAGKLSVALAEDGVAPANLTGAFSVPGSCPGSLCTGHYELLLVAGRESAGKMPFAKECAMSVPDLGKVTVTCGKSEFDGFMEPPSIQAASGAAGSCSVCPAIGPCTTYSCMAEGVLAAWPSPDGGATTAWARTKDETPLGPFLDGGMFSKSNARDISRLGKGPNEGEYIVVGDNGLIAVGKLGSEYQFIPVIPEQTGYKFVSVDARGPNTVVLGFRPLSLGTDVVILVHANHQEITDMETWSLLPLARYPGGKVSGSPAAVSAEQKAIYVVGTETASLDTNGVVFYVTIPAATGP